MKRLWHYLRTTRVDRLTSALAILLAALHGASHNWIGLATIPVGFAIGYCWSPCFAAVASRVSRKRVYHWAWGTVPPDDWEAFNPEGIYEVTVHHWRTTFSPLTAFGRVPAVGSTWAGDLVVAVDSVITPDVSRKTVNETWSIAKRVRIERV